MLRLGGTGEGAEAAIMGKRCAEVAGFNVHANVRVGAKDRDNLEHLCRYLARPPIANDRLQELPDGRLALRFKQAWRDGTTHIVFTPSWVWPGRNISYFGVSFITVPLLEL